MNETKILKEIQIIDDLMQKKKKKSLQIKKSFVDIPFRLIIKILNEYYVVPLLVFKFEQPFYIEKYMNETIKQYKGTEWFGYFKLDRSRKIFQVFKTFIKGSYIGELPINMINYIGQSYFSGKISAYGSEEWYRYVKETWERGKCNRIAYICYHKCNVPMERLSIEYNKILNLKYIHVLYGYIKMEDKNYFIDNGFLTEKDLIIGSDEKENLQICKELSYERSILTKNEALTYFGDNNNNNTKESPLLICRYLGNHIHIRFGHRIVLNRKT